MKYALALTVLVLAGCLGGGCSEPMVLVDGRCCLDADADKVCDDVQEDQKLCEKPYILYAGSCCLDTNGNRVCDDLEAKTEVSLASSSTTTTSTTSTSASSTITSSTTSTTRKTTSTSSTTTVLEKGCYDSDKGKDFNEKGVTVGQSRAPPRDRIREDDYCRDNATLMEYWCQNDRVYEEFHICGTGNICLDGRCCLPVGSRCTNSDECCSGSCHRKQYISLCY